MGILEDRLTNWRTQRKFNKNGKDVISLKDAVQVTVAQQAQRTRAERMLAKWFNLSEHERALLPRYFAAWTLARLQEHQEGRADFISIRITDLNVRFRAAAEHLLGHVVVRDYNLSLLANCWLGFLYLSWEVRRVTQFRLGASRRM